MLKLTAFIAPSLLDHAYIDNDRCLITGGRLECERIETTPGHTEQLLEALNPRFANNVVAWLSEVEGHYAWDIRVEGE